MAKTAPQDLQPLPNENPGSAPVRQRRFMRKLSENTDGGRNAVAARNTWEEALCLHRSRKLRLHDLSCVPASYDST